MSDKVAESFNMARPFKSPQEEQDVEPWVRRDDYDWMVGDRDTWKQRAGGFEREAQRVVVEFHRLTEERDTANQAAEISYQELQQALLECDTTRAEALRLTTERDAAEREKQLTWENLQRMIRKCDAVILERDVSRDENYRLREERNNLNKEVEGLRADALAYPPQRIEFTQYADLKADYDLQATMIETLQEALKRTETLLAKAQAEHIDDRLKGFLSVISQLADQAQDLLP